MSARPGHPGPARIFFDTTFTRTQVGNVGITRTVRRLQEELRASVPPDVPFVPVAFHSGGYCAVDAPAAPQADAPAAAAARDAPAARLLRWMSDSALRRIAFAHLPVPLLHLAWRLQSAATFDRLSQDGTPVDFRPGDVLVMCDAAWCCRSWEAARAARAAGAAVLLMVHDLIPVQQPEFSSALVTRIFGDWLAAMLPACDAVICNSQATENEVRAYAASHGVALPPCGHFRLGSDPARPPAGGDCRADITRFLHDGAPCFGAVGTIEPRKNHAFLLEAFERLWSDGHEVRLLVAGRVNAECQPLARRLLQHPEHGRRLLAVFDASDAEIAQVYERCRALVFPSLAEGFGLPLVEARTRGCPVIASDLPAFAELADAGVFLFDRRSGDALDALVLQHAATDRRAAVAPMPPFTWRDSAAQFLQVGRALLGTAAGGSPARQHPAT